MTNLKWAISTVKKCFVAPNTLNLSLANDDFALRVAVAQLANALKAGEITSEEVEKQIMELEVVQ